MRIFLYIQLQQMVGTALVAARRKAPGIYRQTSMWSIYRQLKENRQILS